MGLALGAVLLVREVRELPAEPAAGEVPEPFA